MANFSVKDINFRCVPNNFAGRPRSEALTTLMIEGSSSPSSIKCSYCNRVFPREKSLQAHLRTHTGTFFCFLFKHSFLFCTWPFKLRHVVCLVVFIFFLHSAFKFYFLSFFFVVRFVYPTR